MKTTLLLMAQYDGAVVIPAELVCRDYFRHLDTPKFIRKVDAGEIDLPLVRIEGSTKAARGVQLIDLAAYIDARADAVGAAFTRACQFLEIEDLHFHDLRHEGISRLFEIGWSIPRVAGVSGHRSWQSLQRYTHLRQTGDKWAGWKWLNMGSLS